MRWGSSARGGWRYQAVAMLLTYLALVGIYTPPSTGFQNIIGVIIIGIGLYAAWKLNARTTVTLTGPHALAGAVQV